MIDCLLDTNYGVTEIYSLDSNEIEDQEIILPEHLQQLVDKAMVEIDKECSE